MRSPWIFFFICFAVISGGVYGALTILVPNRTDSGSNSEIQRNMLQEAKLIEYFCLSRIPPTTSRAAIPAEWGKALGTTIELRENIGEIAALVPEIKANAEALKGLAAGQSFFTLTKAKEGRSYALIYRPQTSVQQYLSLKKPADQAAHEAGVSSQKSLWMITLLTGLGCAGILTILFRYTYGKPPARAE